MRDTGVGSSLNGAAQPARRWCNPLLRELCARCACSTVGHTHTDLSWCLYKWGLYISSFIPFTLYAPFCSITTLVKPSSTALLAFPRALFVIGLINHFQAYLNFLSRKPVAYSQSCCSLSSGIGGRNQGWQGFLKAPEPSGWNSGT